MKSCTNDTTINTHHGNRSAMDDLPGYDQLRQHVVTISIYIFVYCAHNNILLARFHLLYISTQTVVVAIQEII